MDFSSKVIGHDFKVSINFLETVKIPYQQFHLTLCEFFSNNIKLLAIGLDTKYLDSKNVEGSHYHFRFTSYNPPRTIENRKSLFVKSINATGLKGFTHSVCKNGSLKNMDDIYQYLGYALKEQKIYCCPTLEEHPHALHLELNSKNELKSKIKNHEFKEKDLEKKTVKKESTQEALEYLIDFIPQACGLNSVTMLSIFSLLIDFQKKKQVYLHNSQMTIIAHNYIQKHTKMTNDEIAYMRFGKFLN